MLAVLLGLLLRFIGLDAPRPRRPKLRSRAVAGQVKPDPECGPNPKLLPRPEPTLRQACQTLAEHFKEGGRKLAPAELEALLSGIGPYPSLKAYWRALSLLREPITIPRTGPMTGAQRRAWCEVAEEEAIADLQTWRAALAREAHYAAGARRQGYPLPEPLHVPRQVREALDRQAAEALAALQRRQSGGNAGNAGSRPNLKPDDVAVPDGPRPR